MKSPCFSCLDLDEMHATTARNLFQMRPITVTVLSLIKSMASGQPEEHFQRPSDKELRSHFLASVAPSAQQQ